MIVEYFLAGGTKPRSRRGPHYKYIYTRTDPRIGMSPAYWTQISEEQVIELIKDGYIIHDDSKVGIPMKITEVKENEVLMSAVSSGTVFRNTGRYYLKMEGTYAVDLASGVRNMFASDAPVTIVEAELVIKCKKN